MNILAIIFALLIFIILLIIMAITQIKSAGIRVSDFFSFIKANADLDELYMFAKRYDQLSPAEQVTYLKEAEKMFEVFDKIPKFVWEDEYDKYSKVLDIYKNIKIMNWQKK